MVGPCPRSFFLNPAGCKMLTNRGWLLPQKFITQSGMGGKPF